MKKTNRFISLFLFLFLLASLGLAQQIVEGEYFFDNDPGVGRGIRISQNQIENGLEITRGVGGLREGIHTLVVRVKNDANEWSLSLIKTFYVSKSPNVENRTTNIVAGEYFIGDDPGVGNGTPISVNSPDNNIAIRSTVNTQDLAQKNQIIGLRVRDSQGNWSITYTDNFFLQGRYNNNAANTTISAVEYFINTPDPGLGSATSLEVIRENNFYTANGEVNWQALGLNRGRHTLIARARDNLGNWSLSTPQVFDICDPAGVEAGFDIAIDGNQITINDRSSFAEEYEYTLGNGGRIREGSFEYTYSLGGTYEICQTVSNLCATDQSCQEITILAPTLRQGASIPIQYFEEDEEPRIIVENLNDIFDSPSGDPITYSFVESNVLIGEIINNRQLRLGPAPNITGTRNADIDITAAGVTSRYRFRVVITGTNDAPYLQREIDNKTYDEDSNPVTAVTNLPNYFRDYEGDDITFSRAISSSAGVMPEIINNKDLRLSFQRNYHGNATITIYANDSLSHPDNFLTGEASFSVRVNSVLDPPIPVRSISDIRLSDGEERVIADNLTSYFEDGDGDNLTFAGSTDNNKVILTVVGNQSLKVSAEEGYSGSVTGELTASDGILSGRINFTISVTQGNSIPTIDLQDFEICADETKNLNLTTIVSDDNTEFEEFEFNLLITRVNNPNISTDNLRLTQQGSVVQIRSLSPDSGVYTLSFEVIDKDGATAQKTIQISVKGASITFQGDNLIASDGISYQWYNNNQIIDGATGITLSNFAQNGAYTVEVNHGNGCSIQSDPFVFTSIEDPFFLRTTLFPIPASDKISFSLGNDFFGLIHISITDVFGKELSKRHVLKNHEYLEKSLDINMLSDGVYILRMEAKKHLKNFTFIKY